MNRGCATCWAVHTALLAIVHVATQAATQPASQLEEDYLVQARLRLKHSVTQACDAGRKLAAELRHARTAVDVAAIDQELELIQSAAQRLAAGASAEQQALYLRARALTRKLALANPLLDFDRILFVKRAPGSYSHMSDQYYSWWARPGGGLFLLEGFKTESPRARCLTGSFPEGSFLSPDLSYDAKRILFSYCRYYAGRSAIGNKLDKDAQPEDSFYHIFELDLATAGTRQLTRGRYDDIFPRYLPDGRVIFLSTRRGTSIQCDIVMETLDATRPDSFVRCGGDARRPVSIYTLHSMDAGGRDLRATSAFESFEWDPSVADDGRVLYARWDYVDRDNMPYMKLWSTNPDGTNPQIVYGNFTKNPHCIFEARSVPESNKILATASGHHSVTGGSLVLLDPSLGIQDGELPLTRLTPEVCFPETEGWPTSYFANPWPLSEKLYLAAWSSKPLVREGKANPVDATGIYLGDAFGNLELLYRDAAISSASPIPVRPRRVPPAAAASRTDFDGPREGRFFIQDVHTGLEHAGVQRGDIQRLRIVAMPVKTQPNMNTPVLGQTKDDPGKLVLGTVPVERDGSAYFRVPSGVAVFFQALDAHGYAVQTMRSLTYVQPGQTLSCIGCHEKRSAAPPMPAAPPLATGREPSRITPGPQGSWPLRFDKLVQPVLELHCVSCHRPGNTDPAAARTDLTAGQSYDTLVNYAAPGRPSLADRVKRDYAVGYSTANAGPAHTSALLWLLEHRAGHCGLELDDDARQRLALWMDTYAQKQGSFSSEQEQDLLRFRERVADVLAQDLTEPK